MADFGIGESAAAAAAASTAAETGAAIAATSSAAEAGAMAAGAISAAGATTIPAAYTAVGAGAAASGLTAAQWLGLATTVAGTALSARSQSQNAGAQSAMAKLGSKAALQEAQSKQDVAGYAATQFQRRASLLIGQQVATTAASGNVLGTGSALFNEIDASRQAKIEELNLRRTGDVGAASSRFEASLAGYRSSFYDRQTAGIVTSGVAQAGQTILDQFAASSKWSGARR
jgi:hypothetical protein